MRFLPVTSGDGSDEGDAGLEGAVRTGGRGWPGRDRRAPPRETTQLLDAAGGNRACAGAWMLHRPRRPPRNCESHETAKGRLRRVARKALRPRGQELWLPGSRRVTLSRIASGEVPVTTGPQEPAAAGHDGMRASHAEREQVIDVLKNAFVHGRLTMDELGARAGQALTARTRADLAALTADISPSPAATGPGRPPARPRRRMLARAAAKSGVCLIIAAAAIGLAFLVRPPLMFALAACAVWAAIGIMGCAVLTSWDQRSSRRQSPPRPGPGGQALEAGQDGGTGHGPVTPGPPTDQNRADLRAHKSRQHPQHALARAGRVPP